MHSFILVFGLLFALAGIVAIGWGFVKCFTTLIECIEDSDEPENDADE